MITIDSLLKKASDAQDNSLDTNQIEACRWKTESRRAMVAVKAMRDQGLTEVNGILGFDAIHVTRGETVRIKRGAAVFSTHPQVSLDGKVTTRRQDVRVHSVMQGYANPYQDDADHNRNTKVEWLGSGGYYFWTDLNNVEKIQGS